MSPVSFDPHLALNCSTHTYAWLLLVSGIANLVMIGILAPFRHRSGAIAWFQLSSIFTTASCIGVALSGCTTSAAGYDIGYLLTTIIVLAPPTLIAFALYMTDHENLLSRFWLTVVMWLPPLVMLALLWGTNLVGVHGIENAVDSGFDYKIFPPGPLGQLRSAFIGIGFIIPLIILVVHYWHITHRLKRQEIGIIIIGLIPPVLGGVIFEGILPGLGMKTLPMGLILVSVADVVIVYAILRYGMYIFNMRTAIPMVARVMPSSLLVFDHTRTVQYANQHAAALLGYTEQRMIGVPIEKLLKTTSDHHDVLQKINVLSKDQDSLTIPDTVITGKTGSRIHASINVSNVYEGPRLISTIMVISDISKLKEAEVRLEHEKSSVERKVVERTRQLAEAQAQLTASVKSLPFGFALINREGEIMFSNTTFTKLAGRHIPEDPADTKAVLREIATDYRSHIDILECIQRVLSNNRSIERNVEIDASFLRFLFMPVVSGETAIGTVMLLEDTTEEKALERSRDEFFSIASHELRTPLTVIRGSSSMMLEYYGDQLKNPDARQTMEDIHASSIRLITIVNDFLDVSRLEQGRIDFEKKAFPISDLVKSIVGEYKTNSAHHNLSIEYKPDGAFQVLGDMDRTRQIIVNLLSNALKYTEQGSITVSVKTSGRHVEIAVTDTGKGIPEESRHLLFHKFQQATNNILTRDNTQSTGLGLYISQLMARGMGGKLYLQHTEIEQGSTFVLELPSANARTKKGA